MSDVNSVTEGWDKWKIALAVGAPIALGLAGLWYYNRTKAKQIKNKGREENSEEGNEEPLSTDDASESTIQPSTSHQSQSAADDTRTPLQIATDAKNKGNKYFKGGKYENAIKCYTEAITGCPPDKTADLSTFYQNRAAAYEQLKQYSEVINDCSKALEYNNKYTKALFRRAKAHEIEGNLMEALEDVTATCLLEGFSNQQTILMADRVLKTLGSNHAKAAYQNRVPVTPSKQFIRTYFMAFAKDPILNEIDVEKEEPETETTEEEEEEIIVDEAPESEQEKEKDPDPVVESSTEPSPLDKAKKQLEYKEYDSIIELCTEELGNPSSPDITQALLLRGTFHTLRGEGDKAMTDFNQLLNMSDVDERVRSNALIKRGSLKMQNQQQVEALDDFASAVREDPENSDIYHHRGQLHLLLDRVSEAVADFRRSVEISPEFTIGHVQKCYTEYRLALTNRNMAQVQQCLKKFEETLKIYPHCAEGYVLYGQALAEQQQFKNAEDYLTRGLNIEPDNANIYVQKGLLKITYNQDIDSAAKLITRAIELDDKCEYAFETMGTIEVNRGRLDIAIDHFNRAINLAKTEIEMAHLFSLRDGAIAQNAVTKRLGIELPNLA